MLQKYLTELKKIKMLSPEEERELWIREEEGDEAAHQKLTSSYQPLVFKTAVQFHMPEEITLELIQEGMVGLLEAVESYDYTKGVAFSLYAVHRIRGRMCDFMNREFSRRNCRRLEPGRIYPRPAAASGRGGGTPCRIRSCFPGDRPVAAKRKAGFTGYFSGK